MIEPKFRPSLTLSQLQTIHHSLRLSACSDTELLKMLEKYILKAQHGIVSPSHISTPTPTLSESLGFSQEGFEESIEILLKLYENNPKTLSEAQRAKVNHYRYTNDLMSPEEERDYESGTI